DVEEGRYFEEADFTEHRRVLIIGSHASKKVFGTVPPVGQQVSVEGQTFK
ncbi:MAG: ABC transporter permease, partial [Burkholderiaceae bacterium]